MGYFKAKVCCKAFLAFTVFKSLKISTFINTITVFLDISRTAIFAEVQFCPLHDFKLVIGIPLVLFDYV